MIESLLEAEIMGHYRSYQVLGSMVVDLRGRGLQSGHRRLRESMIKEGERIFRLLKILHPNRDMHSAYVGSALERSDRARQCGGVPRHDSRHRSEAPRLLPLFDRDVKPGRRVWRRPTGCSARRSDDRAEAVAIMTLSEDPWLRSCAAYAIGEMQLTAVRADARRVGARRRSAATGDRARRAGEAEGGRGLRRPARSPECDGPAVTVYSEVTASAESCPRSTRRCSRRRSPTADRG